MPAAQLLLGCLAVRRRHLPHQQQRVCQTSCSRAFVRKHMDQVDLIFRRHCFSITAGVGHHSHLIRLIILLGWFALFLKKKKILVDITGAALLIRMNCSQSRGLWANIKMNGSLMKHPVTGSSWISPGSQSLDPRRHNQPLAFFSDAGQLTLKLLRQSTHRILLTLAPRLTPRLIWYHCEPVERSVSLLLTRRAR